MAAFEWRISGIYKASADVAGKVCEQLATSDGGLTPAALVDASRDENAPLHNEFEWNDDVAAEGYRKVQAGGIIRNLCITVQRGNGEVVRDRSFVITPGGESRYTTLDNALSRDDWNKALLKQAHNDMLNFVAKYRRLSELSQVVGIMSTMLQEPTA